MYKSVKIIVAIVGAVISGAWLTDINDSRQAIKKAYYFAGCLIDRMQASGISIPAEANVKLSLAIDPFLLQLTEELQWSLFANRDGFVTLWGLGAGNKVQRIYPTNGWMSIETNALYEPSTVPFKLIAKPPTGPESLVALWTNQEPEMDLAAEYPSIEAFSAGVAQLGDTADQLSIDEAIYCTYQ